MNGIRIFVGIDLGSTTTKAIVLTETGDIIGRGITNSRSNYDVACDIAREEAFTQARLTLLRQALENDPATSLLQKGFLSDLNRNFRMEQHLDRVELLARVLRQEVESPRHRDQQTGLNTVLEKIIAGLRERAAVHFAPLAVRKSDFFRDLAAADYMNLAGQLGGPKTIPFETICALFDAAILVVENTPGGSAFAQHIGNALNRTIVGAASALQPLKPKMLQAVNAARSRELVVAGTVGTGYGRQRLPFPKEQIRSEILCHGLGAHAMFSGTRTVLDIGGQDTKAIQVDPQGIVTSFQMNDRCAAGCGRYLGYIADEMNLGLHELGPLAQQSSCRVKINSTCTVFAGAELRERLSLGQNREDILAGLHRAVILRAMSLLARSGGVSDEFTFTGGVARNPAAVAALKELVYENYGTRKINISPESIYTGALGAAMFAQRAERSAA
jgi:benzoyl-CoA reductase subunit A